jgi:putative peptidoglycan lipid II flippase
MTDGAKNASKQIMLSSLRMATATFLSRILGLVRELVMAAQFGASIWTDAFNVAYRIPNLLRDLFAEGAFSSAFVPNFVAVKNQAGRDVARNLFWSVCTWLIFITASAGLVIFVFAPELIALFAPKFARDIEHLQLAAKLTQIMSPYLLLVSVAALFMGVLNSFHVFFLPALSPAFYNVAMIFSILLAPWFSQKFSLHPIYALAYGVVIGGSLQVLTQLPALFRHHMGFDRPKMLQANETQKVFKQLAPGLIGFAATQVNILVGTILATSTVVGAVSWLQYAFRLFQLPVGILSVSIGNSNLVVFSKEWKAGSKQSAIEVLKSSFDLCLILMLPTAFYLICESRELISLIFQRGKFSAFDSAMTSSALTAYALGLPFYGLHKIAAPCFYAMDKHKIPMYSSLFGIAFNILFCVGLIESHGFSILALGTSISIALNFSILIFLLVRFLDISPSFLLNVKLLKIFSAAAISAICLLTIKHYYLSGVEHSVSFFIQALQVSFRAGIYFSLYAILMVIQGEGELIKKISKKILRK